MRMAERAAGRGYFLNRGRDMAHQQRSRSRSGTPRSGFNKTQVPAAIAEGIEEEPNTMDARCDHVVPINMSNMIVPSLDVTFSASALDHIQMLNQVDRKFIACVLPSDAKGERHSQRTFVVIDQHAADERVSVERLQKELCEGFMTDTMEVTGLKTEIKVVLSREEEAILRQRGVLDIFARWGVRMAMSEMGAGIDTDYAQIRIAAVPAVLAGRLGKKEASELTRLIKLYLSVLDVSLGELRAFLAELVSGETDREGELDWTRALRWMPKEMVELVNSKACRGELHEGSPCVPADKQAQSCSAISLTESNASASSGGCEAVGSPLCALMAGRALSRCLCWVMRPGRVAGRMSVAEGLIGRLGRVSPPDEQIWRRVNPCCMFSFLYALLTHVVGRLGSAL